MECCLLAFPASAAKGPSPEVVLVKVIVLVVMDAVMHGVILQGWMDAVMFVLLKLLCCIRSYSRAKMLSEQPFSSHFFLLLFFLQPCTSAERSAGTALRACCETQTALLLYE